MPTAPQLDPRARRTEDIRAARREEILAAARRVFAKQGFKGTTIADIASEAGIALGTIYLYFPSKEDVFAALSQQFSDLITQGASLPPAADLERTVRRRIDRVFAVCEQNADLVRLAVINTDPGTRVAEGLRSADRKRYSPLAHEIREGMAAGTVRPGDPDVVTNLVVGIVNVAVYQAFVISDGSKAADYSRACADMIIAYLQPQSPAAAAAPAQDEEADAPPASNN